MSAGTYYVEVASAYSSVVVFPELRADGEGICFCLWGGKAENRGFVTRGDLERTARENPDLAAQAKVYQAAFHEGMGRGMADAAKHTGLGPDTQNEMAIGMEVPPGYETHSSSWRQGWLNGYSYGQRMGEVP